MRRWLLILTLGLLGLGAEGLKAGEASFQSLVRVYLDRESSGIVFQGHLIPQPTVRERIQFKGAFLDSRYILSYVGSHGPDLSLPGVRLMVQAWGEAEHPVHLIGVDERIHLAILESTQEHELPLPPTASFSEKGLRVVYPGARGWETDVGSVIRWDSSGHGTPMALQIRAAVPLRDTSIWEGSFVFDPSDRLVGVLTHVALHPFSRRIVNCHLLSFQTIQESVEAVVRKGANVQAGWLGVFLREDSVILDIEEVVPESPAQQAGFLPGDVILKVDERETKNRDDLLSSIKAKKPGDQINVLITRDQEQMLIAATLGEWGGKRPSLAWKLELYEGSGKGHTEKFRVHRTLLPPPLFLGLVVAPLTPQEARSFQSPIDRGLLVKSVLSDSLAQKSGFQSGDILVRVNGRQVEKADDLGKWLELSGNEFLILQFVRKGRVQTERLRLR